MKQPLVINLYAGPGSGKSTTAALVFSLLKTEGIEAELVTEYAKDLTWGGQQQVLRDHQIHVFAEQLKRLDTLIYSEDGPDVIVTDCPILLSSIYGSSLPRPFHELVWSQYERMNNINVMLRRVKPYHTKGRNQTEYEALSLDTLIHGLGIHWDLEVDGTTEGATKIVDFVKLQLKALEFTRKTD